MKDTHTPFVSAADALPANPVKAGTAASMQVLVGPETGAPNFVLRRFQMGAGGGMPLHTNQVEHEQYVLRGRARVRIGDAVHEVSPDTTLYIPAGVAHSYQVTEAPFEFLCVVPNRADQITLVDAR
ncbi:MAG TPA: cupin domain-containing protein [Gemmatimonadaceae bacterium]|jgi:quercetin dioxygenase-like cupin family protein|nr:cupin domain-containing protein [Gemmatimonadaceae bacterium]